MATYTGTNNNDTWTVVNPGTFSLDGLGGVDTLSLGTSLRNTYTITQSSDGAVHVDSLSGASGILHVTLYNIEKLAFASGRDTVDLGTYFSGTAAEPTTTGSAQNDKLTVSTPSASVDGLAGIDTVNIAEPASHFQLQSSSSGHKLVRADGSGTITLSHVERLNFSDKKIALDLDGHAGSVAKILGAVFGAAAVSNPAYVGIGLSLLDSGQYSESGLMAYALQVALGANASPHAVVNLLYRQVVGVAPDAATEQSFVELLTNNVYTTAGLGMLAANTELNLANIALTGLSQTGLAFS